jgi:hypothetical protein
MVGIPSLSNDKRRTGICRNRGRISCCIFSCWTGEAGWESELKEEELSEMIFLIPELVVKVLNIVPSSTPYLVF